MGMLCNRKISLPLCLKYIYTFTIYTFTLELKKNPLGSSFFPQKNVLRKFTSGHMGDEELEDLVPFSGKSAYRLNERVTLFSFLLI